ncbi:hypothetical protein JYT44_02005 [Caldithrix abyssi]|nr:hypothetical protein [Caldithrix abyssi]
MKNVLQKTTKKTWTSILVGLFAVQIYAGDNYEVQDHHYLLVEVKGIVCSFCAFGTEKNLGRLDFVDPKFYDGDGVFLDLEKASITLSVQKDKAIDFTNIGKAIVKGGYVPVASHIKLSGPIVKKNQALFIQNQWNGQQFHLLDEKGQPWIDESYIGKELIIQGVIPFSSQEKELVLETPSVRIKTYKLKRSQGFSESLGEMDN